MARYFILIVIAAILLSACASRPMRTSVSGESTLPEVSTLASDRNDQSGWEMPREAASYFLDTLFSAKFGHNLLLDEEFNRRVLSAHLRYQILKSIAISRRSHRSIILPGEGGPEWANEGNQLMFSAWARPSSFELGPDEPNGAGQIARARFIWGPHVKDYANTSREVSVVLVQERGRWYVDDLCHHKSETSSEDSLTQLLQKTN